MNALLNGIGKLNKHMSPFLGTTEEREALATYFFHELKRGSKESDAPLVLPPIQVQIPEFRQDNEYLILA